MRSKRVTWSLFSTSQSSKLSLVLLRWLVTVVVAAVADVGVDVAAVVEVVEAVSLSPSSCDNSFSLS